MRLLNFRNCFVVLGMVIAPCGVEICRAGGTGEMKEVADSFAQLAAIVMILITIAISTAAMAQ